MPSPKPDPEVAKVNAELATAHAEAAAEDAEEAKAELAKAENPKARLCPNCNNSMFQHTEPEAPQKYLAWHCGTCGGCWRGNQLLEGRAAPAGWPHD
jgi:ribosomal protein S27AE